MDWTIRSIPEFKDLSKLQQKAILRQTRRRDAAAHPYLDLLSRLAMVPGTVVALQFFHPHILLGDGVGLAWNISCSMVAFHFRIRRTLPEIRKCIGGLCPACGYDLRATPDRCPECGSNRWTA